MKKEYKSKVLYQELSSDLKTVDEELRVLLRYETGSVQWHATPEDYCHTRIRTSFVPDVVGAKEWKELSDKIYRKLIERERIRKDQIGLLVSMNKNIIEENVPV